MESAAVVQNVDDLFGEVISSYSRKEAIEDGVLVDLSKLFPCETSSLFKYPVACTAAMWDLVEKAVNNKRYLNDFTGVVWDILYMSQNYIVRRFDPTSHLFQVIITGAGRKRNFTMKAVCGPGDDLEPVITIMLPNED